VVTSNETGSDGIGDMPYEIDADNADRYPLTRLYVTIPGDVDYNGIVNMIDLYLIAMHFGSKMVDLNYIANYDVDSSSTIGMLDLWIAAIHYGQTTE
jgi:hypothetical protein